MGNLQQTQNNIVRTATIDFETKSKVDLKKSGPFKYAQDPTTSILCLAYKFSDELEVKLWRPGLNPPRDLFDHVESGGIVRSHNSEFEFCIWAYVGRRIGWPRLSWDQLQCSAARAAAAALPRSLENLAPAVGADTEKDMAGKRLMMKLSRPRKVKGELQLIEGTEEEKNRLYEYCKKDVLTEIACEERTPPLIPSELELWRYTSSLNERGIKFDRKMVETALSFVGFYTKELQEELSDLTFGMVQTGKQTARLLECLQMNGVNIPDLTAGTVKETLKRSDLSIEARRILEIRQALAMSSVSKLQTMLAMGGADDRLRGMILYHGASTGRFCLDQEHEILTKEGWKKYDTWSGQEIAVFDTDKNIFFEKVNLNVWDYDGEMISCNHKMNCFSVTPEHNFIYWTHRNNPHNILAKDIKTRIDKFPLSGKIQQYKKNDLKTRILVMVQADAHYSLDSSQGRYIIFGFRKGRKIDRCQELLRNEGIKFTSSVDSSGTYTIKIPYKTCPKWLWDFSHKNFSKITFDFFNAASFIEELYFWDGHKYEGQESLEYSTCSEDNAYFAATMAHLTGRSARVVPRQREKWNTNYRVYIRPTDHYRLMPSQISKVQYSGKVFCPETSTGYFLTRRNGLISITGNSGRGVQVQNFPRGSVSDVDNIFEAYALGYDFFKMLYPNVLAAISSSLRGMLIASEGMELFAGDFAAIEARGLLWIAEDEDGLNIFRRGEDIYKEMAGEIYKVDPKKVTKDQRQVGKFAILALGYGMGAKKFVDTCLSFGVTITMEFAERVVAIYRNKFEKVKALWHKVNQCAIEAVQNKGTVYTYKRLSFLYRGNYLMIKLPCGRKLYYNSPKVSVEIKTWGEVESLSFMSVNAKTKKWEREYTYGGKLVENIVQALCRDLMVFSMFELEAAGYKILITVHDEVVSEKEIGKGSVKEFESLMSKAPAWAKGFPIGAEAWKGPRYKK